MGSIVPVHIVAGFLGVGKTTSILNLMKKLEGKEHVAVIVNERGEVGLDGIVMQSADNKLEIREVTGGCICCTAGPLFVQALLEILEKVRPDRIFMEPSGISKPGEILDLIHSLDISSRLDIRPIVTLVDPALFLKPQIMELPLFRNQVDAADIIVANRCDLASETVTEAFYEKAKKLYPPKIAVLSTRFGQLPEEILSLIVDPNKINTNLAGSEAKFEMAFSHSTGTGHPMYNERGWTWYPSTIFAHNELTDIFEALRSGTAGIKGKVERSKGIFHTENGWYLIEQALGEVYEREIQYRRDNRCQIIFSGSDREDVDRVSHLLESCVKD